MKTRFEFIILIAFLLGCSTKDQSGIWISSSKNLSMDGQKIYCVGKDSVQIKLINSSNYWVYKKIQLPRTSALKFSNDSLGIEFNHQMDNVLLYANDSLVQTEQIKKIKSFGPSLSVEYIRNALVGKSIQYNIPGMVYHYDYFKENKLVNITDTINNYSFYYSDVFKLGSEFFFVPNTEITQIIQIQYIDEHKLEGRLFWGEEIEKEISILLKKLPDSFEFLKGKWLTNVKRENEDKFDLTFEFKENKLIQTYKERSDTMMIQPLSDRTHFIILPETGTDFKLKINSITKDKIEIVDFRKPFNKKNSIILERVD